MNLFEWGMNYSFNAYYENCCKVLNIEKFYTEKSLKAAYHKKVLETHPDTGGKTEDFIKVNEAYKFLISLIFDKPKVSKCKDIFPKDSIKNNFSVNNNSKKYNKKISLNNSHNSKAKTNDQNDKVKQNQTDNNTLKNKNKPKNATYKLEIELSDAYFGSRKLIKLNRNRICKKCLDKNQLNSDSYNCEECNGQKYSSQLKEVQLIIKPGTYTGCKVVFKGEGEEYVGYEPGDIIFEILVKENKNFLRKGSDLYTYKNLTIGESLGIDNILINLFDKDQFYVNKNKIMINPGETKSIIGKGFPFFDDNTHRGNLHIKFNFSFPSKMKLEQKNIIKNVFEGKYLQYIKKNENNEKINNNHNNNGNKKIFKKTIIGINKKNQSNLNKQFNKSSFAPKLFNFNIDMKKPNEKIKKTNNNLNRSKSGLNKTINKNPGINNMNKNEKENNLNNLEIYDLVKFEEALINKGYFYNKNN